jgi:hypothetical protein
VRIILRKDLYDANSTFTFQYLMFHVFISFLNYIKHFKRKHTVESYIYTHTHIYIYIYIYIYSFFFF